MKALGLFVVFLLARFTSYLLFLWGFLTIYVGFARPGYETWPYGGLGLVISALAIHKLSTMSRGAAFKIAEKQANE